MPVDGPVIDVAARATTRIAVLIPALNEQETIGHYRNRIRQAEALGEYALSETLRKIIVQEQEHAIDLATALGIDVPRQRD